MKQENTSKELNRFKYDLINRHQTVLTINKNYRRVKYRTKFCKYVCTFLKCEYYKYKLTML